LEDTLKAFMQLIGQSINDVKNATMVNTQEIAKMEIQIKQIASYLGEREREGKVPQLACVESKVAVQWWKFI
jgi:hypothetical protein